MKKPTIYTLDLLDWSVCIGGHHVTGHISWHDGEPHRRDGSNYHRHELERRLSWKEAKALGETEDILWRHDHARVTNRFETRESIERAAIKWVKANANPKRPWLLQYNSTCNPERVLAGNGYSKDRLKHLNDLHDAWDKASDGLRGRDDFREPVYDLYNQLIKPDLSL